MVRFRSFFLQSVIEGGALQVFLHVRPVNRWSLVRSGSVGCQNSLSRYPPSQSSQSFRRLSSGYSFGDKKQQIDRYVVGRNRNILLTSDTSRQMIHWVQELVVCAQVDFSVIYLWSVCSWITWYCVCFSTTLWYQMFLPSVLRFRRALNLRFNPPIILTYIRAYHTRTVIK